MKWIEFKEEVLKQFPQYGWEKNGSLINLRRDFIGGVIIRSYTEEFVEAVHDDVWEAELARLKRTYNGN